MKQVAPPKLLSNVLSLLFCPTLLSLNAFPSILSTTPDSSDFTNTNQKYITAVKYCVRIQYRVKPLLHSSHVTRHTSHKLQSLWLSNQSRSQQAQVALQTSISYRLLRRSKKFMNPLLRRMLLHLTDEKSEME